MASNLYISSSIPKSEGNTTKMKNVIKATFVIFTLLFMLIPFTAAQDLVFKQYEEISLKVPCINNGTYCSSAARCNLTTTYPNGSVLVNNNRMTNQVSFHNYTIAPTPTILGVYHNTVMCVDTAPADQGTSTFDFEVTSSGLDSSQDRARTLWMYVVAGVFFVLLIIFAWKTEFGWIGFLAGVMLLMPGIDLMINGFGMNDILMTRGIATVIIAIAAITMIVFSYEALSSDSTRHKEEDGGEEAEDDHDYFKSA